MNTRSGGRVLAGALFGIALALSAIACQAEARNDSKLVIKGLERGSLSDKDLEKGTSILVFYAGWSPRCRNVVSRVNAIQDRWGGSARVAMVNFQESEKDVREFLRDHKTGVPTYLDKDGELSKRYAVTQLPYLLVIRDGKVLSQGRLPEEADEAIASVLK